MNNILNKAIDWLCLSLFFILISFPIFQILGRYINFFSIPASQEIVQHMTLWIGFIGAVIAARSNKLLSVVREPVFKSLKKVSLSQFFVHIFSLSVVFVLSVSYLKMIQIGFQYPDYIAPFIPTWFAQSIIPFGLILTKIFTKNDIRKVGSGNIGATNVLRTGNKILSLVTLLLDSLKGFIPVMLTSENFPELIQLSCLLCFLGHVFPIWLKFKGGKGVATYVGILCCLNIYLGISFGIVWLISFFIFKYSSLSSLLGSLSVPIVNFFILKEDVIFFYIIMFVLIFYTHRENIKRLLNRSESKTKIY